jgi:hypothetical protein
MDEDEVVEVASLAWRGEPAARLHCGPDGQLYLTGVELSAWQRNTGVRWRTAPRRAWSVLRFAIWR